MEVVESVPLAMLQWLDSRKYKAMRHPQKKIREHFARGAGKGRA
jgi:hypothetical protein